MRLSNVVKTFLLSAATLSGGLVAPAFAVDEVNVSSGATVPGPGLAVRGYDVISYYEDGAPQAGNAEFSYAYNGATYRFSSKAHLRKFKADPAKYAPAYGGFCAYGVALGKKFDGDPNFWRIVDGQLYLNLNQSIQTAWTKDVAGNLQKADANWINIESVAVEAL